MQTKKSMILTCQSVRMLAHQNSSLKFDHFLKRIKAYHHSITHRCAKISPTKLVLTFQQNQEEENFKKTHKIYNQCYIIQQHFTLSNTKNRTRGEIKNQT